LIDPLLVSVIREVGASEAYAEIEGEYQRFMSAPEQTSARGFIEFWNGAGAWDKLGEKARTVITGLVPKVRLELIAAREDQTPLREIVGDARPLTQIVVGERTRLGPRVVARQLAQLFGAETVVVPSAGHMLPLTHPEAVAEAVLNFQRA
jgi:pimeloyl-ACP methyl ester carboxylesterase